MITGHFGITGFARSFVREPLKPLYFFLLLGASVSPDVLDMFYWLFEVCSPSGLYSHTIYAVALQAAVIGGIALLVTGSRAAALLFACAVLLHMPADWITGRKLFVPGAELMGLRLYDRPLWDWAVEVPILVAGWWMLRRAGRGPRWATTAYALAGMILGQTVFDLLTGGGVKPNACLNAAIPSPAALVTAPLTRHVGAPSQPLHHSDSSIP
ncbi:MAG: hypothetical protein ABIY52_14570 [Gemmatimonadaceae bacterium]